MEDDKRLYAAFLAGFKISREGKNGECYYKFRRNGDGEIELFPFDEYMEGKFQQWLKEGNNDG